MPAFLISAPFSASSLLIMFSNSFTDIGNGSQPSFDIRGKLESLDLGRAGQAIFGHQTVQGRGDVIIEVATAGDSGTTLLSSLDGKLSVTGPASHDRWTAHLRVRTPKNASIVPMSTRISAIQSMTRMAYSVATISHSFKGLTPFCFPSGASLRLRRTRFSSPASC